jgi:Kef-type K+ transport system membrane component KefB
MGEISFSGLLIVSAVAFAAPFLLGLAPGLRLPAVVLELVAGIVVGPSVLGWVEIDEPVRVLSLVGLAFLLFLAGLEIDLDRLVGPRLASVSAGLAASFGIAVAAGFGLQAVGLVEAPLLVAIVLMATSLGVVVPVLKDSDRLGSELGQLVIAAATIADFGAVILLSLLFSREATGLGAQLVLLGGFALAAVAVAFALLRAERSRPLSRLLLRLQDTTAQIRVRGAFLLLVAFVTLAEVLGLEVILGAFIAGAVLSLVDRDETMTHPRFRVKLEASGFGIFIPVFFVTSGVQFDLGSLFAGPATVALVPVFLVALLLVRALPALAYRRALGARGTVVAGLLQATSLPFIVAATMIGTELGLLDGATAAALVAAGLVSVLVLPLAALTILRRGEPARERPSAGTREALA